MLDDGVDRFPLAVAEDDVTRQVGALSAEMTEVEDFPSDHDVNREAIFQAIHGLKISLLDAAAGLQDAKINLDFPALTVVTNDLLHFVDRVDG